MRGQTPPCGGVELNRKSMSQSATKARPKHKAKKTSADKTAKANGASVWARAFRDQLPILVAGALYVLCIIGESIYCGVPLRQFMRIAYILPIIMIKCVILLLGFGAVSFVRGLFRRGARKKPLAGRIGFAWAYTDKLVSRYLDGEVFAYGCIGLLVAAANSFYFIQKSLVHVLHFYSWDEAFIAADRFLHFGHQPNEFVVWLTQTFHLGHVLDIGYFLWFVVMYAILGYGLFWDNNLKRRLKFLWCFLMAWVLLGSVMGLWFSAAGPLFYHDFFPRQPDPYADFVKYISDFGPHEFPIAFWSGQHLLEWTTNGELVNINAVVAFPSMHIAIAWLATLYGFSINRKLGYAGVAFCGIIYLATVLFGYHYAIDSYVSLAVVSLMWWATGKYLDRRYPGEPKLKRV